MQFVKKQKGIQLHRLIRTLYGLSQKLALQLFIQTIKRAKILEKLVMETYPCHRQPNLNKNKILSLYDAFDYRLKTQNMIFIGPTGNGRTGPATAFLIQAITRGYNGDFILFPELIERLYQSVADHSEAKIMKRFCAYVQ